MAKSKFIVNCSMRIHTKLQAWMCAWYVLIFVSSCCIPNEGPICWAAWL